MNIILDEIEYIKNMIKNNQIGEKPSKTLYLMTKYYKQIEGKKKKEIYNLLEKYMEKNYPSFNIAKWQHHIDKIINKAYRDKTPLVKVGYVPITKKEFEIVKNIKNKRLQRLCFTMLCVAKFNLIAKEKSNGWVNLPDKEIFKLANIKTTQKQQCLMLNDLMNIGLISFSKKVDNLNNRIEFIDEVVVENENKIVVKVDDFRNLGYLWEYLNGGKFVKCEICGILVKPKSNRTKYCKECAFKIHKEIDRKYQQNKKKNKKSTNRK